MRPSPRPFSEESPQRDAYYAPPPADASPDPMQLWLQQRDDASRARLASPLVLGARRIELAAQRCRELEEQLEITRHRLLNPGGVDGSVVLQLEERAMKQAAELHAERLAVWKDLQPLAQQITDASLEAMRQHWLDLLGRADSGGDGR